MADAVSVPSRRERRRWPLALRVGAFLVLIVVGLAMLSLVYTPHPPGVMRMSARLSGPSLAHWLGTDHFGRDTASLIMAGARQSLLAGVIAVAIGAVFGIALGLVAALRQGTWIDDALMRTADFTFAFPAVLTAVMITTLRGPGLVNAIVAIGIFNIPVFARVTRGAARQVLARDFILAARAAGVPGGRILWRHVLPNIASLAIVQASTQFALAILAEAGLSYLGLGTQPPEASWGRMLAEAQTHAQRQPMLAIAPGLAIAIAVLGFNLLGDGLRDHLDPRHEQRQA